MSEMSDSEAAVVQVACELVSLRAGLMSGTVPPSEGQQELARLLEQLSEAVTRLYEAWYAEENETDDE